jgi:23S rRNA (cytosine1962-C5)-methyltransferase
MSVIVLKPREDRRIRAGHRWVFSNEIAEIREPGENGGLVDLENSRHQFMGRGYYNRHSLIALRLLTARREEIDRAFFVRRLKAASAYRETVLPGVQSCRLVFSEADRLPGLIVDRYGQYLVAQFLTLGVEKLQSLIVEALVEVFTPKGILLRNDTAFRELEGLPEGVEIAMGEIPEQIEIEESGARFLVDCHRGQKTGFFWDQRNNRAVARQLASGRRVLDCFSYSGGFAINAALGGAVGVTAVDNSTVALELLKENAGLNDVTDRVQTVSANCFDYLKTLSGSGEQFDLIVLDPPAFVKSKAKLNAALIGYREINRSAMKLLPPGGVLVSCSCSQNLAPSAFHEVLRGAARDAGRQFRLRGELAQAADHPILLAMPETQYLKGLILERVA